MTKKYITVREFALKSGKAESTIYGKALRGFFIDTKKELRRGREYIVIADSELERLGYR